MQRSPASLWRRPILPIIGLLVAGLAAPLAAQVPAVPTAFPNNQTFTPGQLLWRQVGLGRVTNIVYHNGSVYTNIVTGADRRVFEWSDPTDISSLTQVLANENGDAIPLYNDHGNHAHTKVGDWFGGTFGMQIRRDSVGTNAFGPTHPDWIGTPNDHQLYWPWSLPFNWIQYNSSNNGDAFIRRLDEVLYEWNSLAEHGVTGNSILMGNILLITSDESLLGVLAYDISPVFQNPPQPPILLDKLTGPVGAYLAVLWENYIVFSRRDSNTVDIVDWSDPTNLRFVTSIDTQGTTELNAGTNVPYVQAQDEFIFTRRHKINMETFEPVLELDEVGDNRPAGSVSGPLGTSQYLLPVGQFLITGAYSAQNRDGVGIWAHQAEPDTRAPSVGYHIPRDGQTNYPTRAPISILIHETLESYTMISGETVLLRPAGDSGSVDCWISFSHDDIMTVTPKNELQADTTYELIIVPDGIKDAVGNGIEGYSFTFSTGNTLGGGNQSPVISSFSANPAPAAPGETVTISALVTDPETDPVEYKFTFGDGSPSTGWISSNQVEHTFSEIGHYDLKVQVRDQKPNGTTSQVTDVIAFTVGMAPSGPLPTRSSPLVLDEANRHLWVVNPDNNSVSLLDADTGTLLQEQELATYLGVPSADPRSIGVAGDGRIWVACRDADGVVLLDPSDGRPTLFLETGFGSAPVGLAVSPNGNEVFVTLEGRGTSNAGNGQLLRFDALTAVETGRVELGPMPRAIAVTGDGSRILVTRFLSGENYGEVWDISNSSTLSLTRTILLQRDRGDRGIDGSSAGGGVPNYVSSISISPDGQWAWYTAKKDETRRGELFDAENNSGLLTHDHTVRAMVGRIDLSTNQEPNSGGSDPNTSSRLDIDNSEGPMAVTFSPFGDYAFVALQGNNEVAVYDVLAVDAGTSRTTTWRIPAGDAPQGIILDPATNRVLIKNFMSRDVTAHDLNGFFTSGDRSLNPATIPTVTNELLAMDVLNGKTIFYSADDRMSFENYISCASCHIDGMHDGRVYDFTQRGEGLRNTTDLRGRGGMAHGNVHWTGNFDEVQDFILDIMLHFGGTGLLPEGEIGHPSLGSPNAGRSTDLDDLAAYLVSLGHETVPKSPYRAFDGALTAEAMLGASLFQRENCVSCHLPPRYNDSTAPEATLHDVGTLRTTSGDRLDAQLTGIDTPTLHGVWAGAPYFHDGQAQTLDDVFVVAGGETLQAENGALSGSASIPGYQDINWDGSAHGAAVRMGASGTVTFSNVDGGAGGLGAVEVRYTSGRNGNMRITVNGVDYDRPIQNDATRLEWLTARIEDVGLTPGASNTIQIASIGTDYAIDDVTITRPNERMRAYPHRRVLDLSDTEQRELIAYVRQLDGRDEAGTVLPFQLPHEYQDKINSGGEGVNRFAADTGYDSGSIGATSDAIAREVPNAVDEAIYQSERYGDFTYTLWGLKANTPHTVRLHFAEIYWETAGSRLFDVDITNRAGLELDDLDLIAVAGHDEAVVQEFVDVSSDANGRITIVFTSEVNFATVSGIEILSQDSVVDFSTWASLLVDDSSQREASSDLDGDGNPLIYEYSANFLPTIAESAGLIFDLDDASNRFDFTFRQSNNTAGLVWIIEYSEDLTRWTAGYASDGTTGNPDGSITVVDAGVDSDGTPLRRASIIPDDPGALFLRIQLVEE